MFHNIAKLCCYFGQYLRDSSPHSHARLTYLLYALSINSYKLHQNSAPFNVCVCVCVGESCCMCFSVHLYKSLLCGSVSAPRKGTFLVCVARVWNVNCCVMWAYTKSIASLQSEPRVLCYKNSILKKHILFHHYTLHTHTHKRTRGNSCEHHYSIFLIKQLYV